MVLNPNGNIEQYANDDVIVVGMWEFDYCVCAAGGDPLTLDFNSLATSSSSLSTPTVRSANLSTTSVTVSISKT